MKKRFSIFSAFIMALAFNTSLFAKTLTNEDITQSYYKSYDYEKSGNYTDAIKALQLVYQEYPKTYTVNNRLAYLYRLDGSFRNAIEHYKIAIKILPSSIEAKSGLQYTYLLAKNYTKVLSIGYQIISVDYYNYYANYRIAYALKKDKKLDLAKKIINKMLLIYPTNALFLSELGLLYKQQGRLSLAKSTLLNVLILDPENVRVKTALQYLDD